MSNGKIKCEQLKAIRKEIAKKYELDYNPSECHHQGDCLGTCPKCDEELKDLQQQLKDKNITEISLLDQQLNSNNSANQIEDEEFNPEIKLEGEIIPPGYISRILPPTPPRILYKKCSIAGLSYSNIKEQWDELKVGTKLALIRDFDNIYDNNAVAVALDSDYEGDPDDFDFDLKLGYIPRTENELIANLLSLGWYKLLECEICSIKKSGPYKDRIQIAIYLKNKSLVQTDYRAVRMDDEEYDNFCSTLEEKGHILYRWSFFPPWRDGFPKEGDKIMFIHQNQDSTSLYYMYLLAKEDNVFPFVNDMNDLHRLDDCIPYVLINIKGPINVSNEKVAFLHKEKISNLPKYYLSQSSNEILMKIFKDTDL